MTAAPPSRPRLVLLHGGGTDHRLWAPVLPRLAPHFDTLAPDLPGHGDEPAPPEPSVEGVARAIAPRLAARLGTAPYALLGHSFGAMVAMALASTALAPPTHLVLADPFLRPATGIDRTVRMWALEVGARLLGSRNAARVGLERMGVDRAPPDDPLRLSMEHPHAWPMHRMLRAHRRFDGRPHLARVRCPTLALMAGGSPATDGEGERLARAVADGHVEIMPRVGHLQMRDDPDGFAAAVIRFVLGPDAAAPLTPPRSPAPGTAPGAPRAAASSR